MKALFPVVLAPCLPRPSLGRGTAAAIELGRIGQNRNHSDRPIDASIFITVRDFIRGEKAPNLTKLNKREVREPIAVPI
jgi:hypothetical protein